MNKCKNIYIKYEEFKKWWIQGQYKYNSLNFPTPKYQNGFISDGKLKIIHIDNSNNIILKYDITRKDNIRHINLKEEVHFFYDLELNTINCIIENTLGSFSNDVNIIKFTKDKIIILIDNYSSETFNKKLIKRKFIITKKDYGYFIEDLLKINNLWRAKGYSKCSILKKNNLL